MKSLELSTKGEDSLEGKIEDVDIPKPSEHEVLIKTVVTGTNPKDWKYVFWKSNTPGWWGDDIAGVVEAVGSKVYDIKKGDRVAAFHVMGGPHGSMAEYSIAPASTTFHIPEKISFEEAATIPLTIYTAGVGLHGDLGLPPPWRPATEELPLVVYGGSSSNGLFALKLARLSGIHPLITIAGGGADIIKEGNYADVIIDYRNESDISGAIKKALNGKPLKYAYDAIAEHGSTEHIAKAMQDGGLITGVLPIKNKNLPNNVQYNFTYVGSVHGTYEGQVKDDVFKRNSLYALVLSRYITRALEEGDLKGHPYEVAKGGLNAIVEKLLDLKNGKVRAKKIVARIDETEGVKKS